MFDAPLSVQSANFIHRLTVLAAAMVLSLPLSSPIAAAQQGTAFNYQGVLKSGGSPYNGTADFEFRLFDSAAGATQIGAMIPYSSVTVADGLFATPLDFGALAFAGDERWLEVSVRTPAGGAGGFTILAPRQKVASVPYASFALKSELSGSYSSAMNFTNAANTFTGAFSGSGAGLTGISPAGIGPGTASINITGNAANANFATSAQNATNAVNVTGTVGIANGGTGANSAANARSNLGAAAASHTHSAADVVSGVLADGRLSGTYTGALTFSNATNSFAGSGAGLTSLNASNITTGTLDDARLSASLMNRIPDTGFQATPTMHWTGLGGGASTIEDIAVSGSFAYVALGSSGGTVMNLTNPANPYVWASMPVGPSVSIALGNGHAYVLSTVGTLATLNLSNPGSPINVGTTAVAGTPVDIVVTGTYAYVACEGDDTIRVYSLSAPSTPAFVGSVAVGAINPHTIVASGAYLYVLSADTNALRIFSISNPAAPAFVGSATTSTTGNLDVVVTGTTAVVSTDSGLRLFDVSTPAAPVALPNPNPTPWFWPERLASAGSYVLVSDRYYPRLHVIDVSTPSATVVVGQANVVDDVSVIAVSGGYAYVGTATGVFQPFSLGASANHSTQAVYSAAGFAGSGTNLTDLGANNVTWGQFDSDRLPTGGSWWLTQALSMDYGTFYLDPASNRIGVGTTTPIDGLLHLNSDQFGSVSTNIKFTNYSTGASSSDGLFVGLGSGSDPDGWIWQRETAAMKFGTGNVERMRISGGGNVGIGTGTPGTLLHLDKNTDEPVSIAIDSGASTAQYSTIEFLDRGVDRIGLGKDANGDFYIDNAGVARMFTIQRTTANVGIDRAPTANKLEVEGNASKAVAGSWLANSDARIKTDVQTVTHALDTLDRVRLVSFNYTPEYLEQHPSIEDRRYLNIIAQEFAQVFPEHVRGSGEFLPNGEEILQVDIHPLTIYAAAAIQELNAKVKALEARPTAQGATLSISREEVTNMLAAKNAEVAALRDEVGELKSELATLRALVDRLIEDKK